MTDNLHKAYLCAIGAILVAGGLFWWRQSERHAGAIAVLTHQNDSTIQVQVGIVQQTAQKAHQDSIHQVAALSAARQQVARQKADSARQDSLVRQAHDERAQALAVVADSLATVHALRDQVVRLVEGGQRDSVTAAELQRQTARTIQSLLATVEADSTALASSRAELNAVKSLADLRLRETNLLKQQQPSFVSRHVAVGVGYGCSTKECAPMVGAMVRVWP